jgi:hypothetical protein
MCAANEAPKQDVLQANLHFPTIVYTIEKPEFLEAVSKIAEEALVEIRAKTPLNEIYPVHMTGNLFDKTDIIPFQYYVGQTAANILDDVVPRTLQALCDGSAHSWCWLTDRRLLFPRSTRRLLTRCVPRSPRWKATDLME